MTNIQVSALLRKDRIATLGGFGMKRQSSVPSKKGYVRKPKHPKGGE